MQILEKGKLKDIKDIKLSYSKMKALDVSIEQFIYDLANPPEQTPAMVFGSAFHAYILEPEKFASEFVIMPEINRRTNAGKAEFEQFEADNKGKTIITAEQMQTLKEMKKKFKEHELANKILTQKGNEFEKFFEINWNKQKFSGVFDIVNEEKFIIADLKTCESADTVDLVREIEKYKYYIQNTLYLSYFAKKECTVEPIFFFIFIEKSAPYGINVVTLDRTWLEYGFQEVDRLVEKWQRFCSKPFIFKGISDTITTLEMPAYLKNKRKNPGASKSDAIYEKKNSLKLKHKPSQNLLK